MICPVCGARLHENVCENCGYSIKEKSEMIITEADESDDVDENNDGTTLINGIVSVLVIATMVALMSLYLYSFRAEDIYEFSENLFGERENIYENLSPYDYSIYENLSPYGYSIQQNDENTDGIKVKKIDPKTGKEVEDGTFWGSEILD